MKEININSGWTMRLSDCDDGAGIENIIKPGESFDACLPCSVMTVLLEAGRIEDPFWRDNELKYLKIADHSFTFSKKITLPEKSQNDEKTYIQFTSIDTLARILLDGKEIGRANNMFRSWNFDVSGEKACDHELLVVIDSPTRYIAEENAKVFCGGSWDAMPGYPHLRKAACMFGWDWGVRIPDQGLYGNASIITENGPVIDSVYFSQDHEITGTSDNGNIVKSVTVTAKINIRNQKNPVGVRFILTSPKGDEFSTEVVAETRPVGGGDCFAVGDGTAKSLATDGSVQLSLTVENPDLWWPNGYGNQPLYQAEIALYDKENDKETKNQLDSKKYRLGLRTVTVSTDDLPDEKLDSHLKDQSPDTMPSKDFAVTVNGLKIFAMGADYIPEDSLLPRMNEGRTRQLLSDAVESHMNLVRVWGGGFYPDDYFYDICDELGLLVWQDFMYACANYELNDKFEENIREESVQVVQRLRHHASLLAWCGNNEMETQTIENSWRPSEKQRYDYIKFFEYIIPKIVKEHDPDRFYWPSSPSSGGNYVNPWAENVGDTHYWGVWHGNEPFTAYRKHHYRFLSEFGFQSFPCMATIRSFTEESDRNPYSRVMEMHQRNTAANGKLMNYLSDTFLFPKDMDSLVYETQLLQAESIRYGVEHFRRHRGTCRGTVVWQLNDIWPVASWASIDYFGRWKALQYAEKRFFEPVHISCEEHGEMDQKPHVNTLPIPLDFSTDLSVANETGLEFTGLVKWELLDSSGSKAVTKGEEKVCVSPYTSLWLPHLDFNKYIEENDSVTELHLHFALYESKTLVSEGTALFCAPKHYKFKNPDLQMTYDAENESVTVTAKAFAYGVCIESEDGNLRLSDNFFNMEAGSRTLKVISGKPSRVRSLYGCNV